MTLILSAFLLLISSTILNSTEVHIQIYQARQLLIPAFVLIEQHELPLLAVAISSNFVNGADIQLSIVKFGRVWSSWGPHHPILPRQKNRNIPESSTLQNVTLSISFWRILTLFWIFVLVSLGSIHPWRCRQHSRWIAVASQLISFVVWRKTLELLMAVQQLPF